MRHGADRSAPKLWTPHTYQQTCVSFLHERTSLNPEGKGGGALFLEPGLGKTSSTLEWIRQMREFGYANRFLIVAPLRVVYQVWPSEIEGWTNFRHLSYSVVHGTAQVRRKRLATQTSIHIINRDAVGWLEKQLRGRSVMPWQAVIVDESTSFRNWSATRSKALREIVKRIPYRVILTGTPAPRNLADLFPQIWLLDQGQALGENITRFREQYCMQIGERKLNNFAFRVDMQDRIHESIRHLVLRLDAKDHLSIPEVTFHDIVVSMPSHAMSQYRLMEQELFLALQDAERNIPNAGAKYNACRQIANGGLYDDNRQVHHLHDAKTEACVDLIDELGGKPLLIAYQFEHDVQRLERAIKGLHVIRGGTKESKIQDIVDRWNTDTLDPPYLAVQPQALSYGVNMQYGSCRDICWYGPTDNLDIYLQLNARIHRQGVGSSVRIHRLRTEGTLDDIIWDRTDDKEDVQSKLLDVLREYAWQRMGGHVSRSANSHV